MTRSLSIFSVLALALAFALPSHAQTTLVRISADNLTIRDSVHKNRVDARHVRFGETRSSAPFTWHGRPGSIGWGSGDVGFSTSTDAGKTLALRQSAGLTVNYQGGTMVRLRILPWLIDASTASG